MFTLTYKPATPNDIPLIVALVNAAYRGETSKLGWTTEADILGGQRTDEEEIARLIAGEDSLILLCINEGEVIGTALLKRLDDGAYLGMFTIKPRLQGQGFGKQFLAAAEQTVRQRWRVSKITLGVINLRHELMSYYERRGYRRTGRVEPFPHDPRFGIPMVDSLQFEYLEKLLP